MQGGGDRCYQTLNEFPDSQGGTFQSLQLTYASCSPDYSRACMWTAAYTLGPNDSNLGLNSICTTGGTNNVAYDETGNPIIGQRIPDSTTNLFSSTPANAPFVPGDCLTEAGPVGGLYRSKRVYCDTCSLPAEYASLPTYDQRSFIGTTTTAPASSTINVSFNPAITSTCTTVNVGDGSTTVQNQPVWAYWTNSTSCSGNPSYVFVGDADHCVQTVTSLSGNNYLDLTFLSCSSDNQNACTYTASYQVPADVPQNFACTTGSTDFTGAALPANQGAPISPNNQFAALPPNAPFSTGTCYAATTSSFLSRSYKVYCSFSSMPAAYQTVPLTTGQTVLA